MNQARVHTGFHYPRSFVTAARSLINLPRFVTEFRKAIVTNNDMLYAIARKGSKVNAKRFFKMFREMKAPIDRGSPRHKKLFNSSLIEDVFKVKEYVFDYSIVRDILRNQMDKKAVNVLLGTQVMQVEKKNDGEFILHLAGGGSISARYVFNCTYSLINKLLESSDEALLPLKHEITEVVLVEVPDELQGIGVTVMDGPFFSVIPFPAEGCYSITHVRYTPHNSWQDCSPCVDSHQLLRKNPPASKFPYMIRDAVRFMPCMSECRQLKSLFEVKTVLLKNEIDDGRPILLKQQEFLGKFYSILGSKIDNVYDLFSFLGTLKKEFRDAESKWDL